MNEELKVGDIFQYIGARGGGKAMLQVVASKGECTGCFGFKGVVNIGICKRLPDCAGHWKYIKLSDREVRKMNSKNNNLSKCNT